MCQSKRNYEDPDILCKYIIIEVPCNKLLGMLSP
jgi:hypothetical protein